MTGDATISGNLTVSGTTTTINTETINLADNIITLNSNFTTGVPTENAGIEIRRGSSATRQFIWQETNSRWYSDTNLFVDGVLRNTSNVNSTGAAGIIITSGDRLGFDQSGVRSWNIAASGGNLNLSSGDGAGVFVFTGTIDTGQGATEVHLMNQNLRTTDNVTHATITATNGVSVTGGNLSVSAGNITLSGTIDTGQGATEVHLMNQNVRTTDNVTFGNLTSGRHIISTAGADWATSGVIGTAIDALHLWPSNVANFGSAITFGARDSGPTTNANAGIYVRSGGGFGTTMALATTDSYAAGSQVAVFIDAGGNTTIRRGSLTASNTIIESSANDQGITLNATDNSWKYIGFSWSNARRSYIGVNASGEPEWGTDNGNTFRFTGSSTLTIGGNIALHAGNFTSYSLPIGGSWYGLNMPGSRWGGYAVNGGEIVFGRDLPNVGQMGMLIDGAYLAGENNGFWSLPSDNNWNGRRGFNWDGTQLNFTTNSPIALFSDLRAPIFYDSNNTAFFGDFASTSNILYITMPHRGNGTENILVNNGGSENWNAINIRGGANNHIGIGYHSTSRSVFGRDGASIHFDDGSSFRLHTNGWDTEFEVTGDGRAWLKDRLGIATTDFSFTSSDNASVINTITNNRLFVNGSIQLLGNQDAIVFGRGAASFMRDEEIGFGWGGGWFMTDSTFLRVRNGSSVQLYTPGIMRADGDMRAPIFYDQNDTTYRIDPNGNSIVDTMEFGGDWTINTSNGSKIFGMFVPDGKYQTRNWHAGDGNYVWSGMQYVTGMSDSPIGSYSHRGTGDWQGWRQNGWVPIDRTKTYKVSAWIRTISGNPYCFLSFTQAGFDYSQPDNGGWGQPYYWNGVAPNTWTEYTMTIGPAGSGAQYTWYGYARFMQLGFLHNYLYSGFNGRAEFVGFKIEEVDNTLAANTNVLGDLYANRFIDRNDGAFFIDPADGGFNVRGGSGNRVTLSTNDSGFRVQNAEGNGVSDVRLGAAWGRPGIYSNTYLSLGSGGTYIEFVTGNSQHGYIDNGANLFAFGSMRSPIFYDNNNTGFYFDGASTSNLNGLNVNSTLNMYARSYYTNYLVSRDNGGLMGDYNVTGTSSKVIWTIGESWPIGNMYGIGYQYGGFGPYGTQHQIVLRENGTTYTQFGMAGNMHLIGSGNATVDFRAPIFYDNANTGFFLDPNGTSNLGGLTLAANVSTGRGAYGSGTANLVLLSDATYGRATIDFRSGVNYPSDGAQIYYETATNLSSGETSRLVIRTENDADDSILIRGGFIILNSTTVDGGSTNPGVRTQYNGNDRLYTFSDNTTEVGSFRAPIFYDSNNTAFFTDPAGRSRLSSLDYGDGGYFFGGGDWGWRHNTPFGWIQFGPANSGHAHIYTSLSNFYLNAPIQVNGVSIMNTNDIRTRIFYDVDNTGFYTDPASTSVLNVLNVQGGLNAHAGIVRLNEIRFTDTAGSTASDPYTLRWISETSARGAGNSWLEFQLNDDAGEEIRIYGNSCVGFGCGVYSDNLYHRFRADGYAWHAGTLEASGDMRSPIFYDSNNTGFYVDAASTSNLNVLNIAFGGNVLFDPGWGFYGFPGLNANSYAGAPIMGFTYANNAPYSGQLVSFGSGGYNLQLNSNYGGSGGGLAYRARNGDNGTWNPWRYPVIYGFNTNGGGDIFATIYYDQSNTGFYLDPASNSSIRGRLDVQGGHGNSQIRVTANGPELGTGQTSTMTWWVSEPGVTWNAGGFGYNVTNDGGSPSGFSRLNGNYGQAYMRFDTSGDLYFYNTNTSGTRFSAMDLYAGNYIYVHNYLAAGGSLRAPIFYDSNNTAYYVDAGGDSGVRAGVFNGNLWINPRPESYGEGITFNMPNQATWGGLRWYRNGPGGGFSGNWAFGYFGNESNNDVGFHNGTNGWRLDQSFNMTSIGSVRAPIFYDSSDTSFYFDGNGTTRWQGLDDYSKMRIGLTGRPGSNFRRNDYTGDTGYWVGTMGWGTTDMNTVASWGSGFIDSWSNPGNQPSGTSHWVGTQAYHYAYGGNSNTGWQLVGGPISNLRFRNAWGGWSGWTTIAMHDRNDGSGGALYAGMYYDSNDTGYYLDPNSGAANCLRVVGGIHVSVGNTTGNGIILADDGDIVDLNDGYCAMRFSLGVRVHSANRGGGPVIALREFGGIIAADNITAYGSPSDARKKENVTPIENALEKVTKLRGVEFDWKENTDEWIYTKIKHDIGFIAQEVQEVEPKLVREGGDGFLGLRDRAIPALLVEAIKELKAELDEARNEIKQLREEILKK